MNIKSIALFLMTALPTNAAITTTIPPASASLLALEQDFTFIELFLSDILSNYNSYTSYMAANKMVFPEDLLQFYLNLDSQNGEFPTSLFVSNFPYKAFKTYITALPWYTDLLDSAGIKTIYVPEDFITTVIEDSTYLSSPAASISHIGLSSAGVSSTSSIARQTSTGYSVASTSTSFRPSSSGSSNSSSTAVETISSSPSTAGGSLLAVPGITFAILLSLLF